MRARSSIWPPKPQEWSGSLRPIPPGQITAKSPRAGRSRQRRAFVRARTPRPWGEMTSGTASAGGVLGVYLAGATTIAYRSTPLWAR